MSATNTDNDNPPGISILDASIVEGQSGTTGLGLTVTLSAPSGKPVAVAYGVANGTAVAPGDFTPISGVLEWAPGVVSHTVNRRRRG